MSIRVLLEERITQGRLIISDRQTKVHHLLGVMKVKKHDDLRVFNEVDGEWEATVVQAEHSGKKSFLEIEIHSQVRVPEARSGIIIAFALIKPDRLRFLIEKTTEIGADGFIPIVSDRCVVRDVNLEKIQAYVAGAVEQSERMTIPKIMPICRLKDLPKTYHAEQIIFCNEIEHDKSISTMAGMRHDKIILIGPEGGFTDQERNLLMAYTNVHSVFLTKNILRSETAAIFAMSRLF